MSLSDKERDELQRKADKRLAQRGAPYHGATEEDVLRMKEGFQVMDGVLSNLRGRVDAMDTAVRSSLDVATEAKVGLTALRSMLFCKGIIDKAEYEQTLADKQIRDAGLVRKTGAAQSGDSVIVSFVMTCEGRVVDDKSKKPLRYDVGCGFLPIDDRLIGASEGDHLVIGALWPAGRKFKGVEGKMVEFDLRVRYVCEKPVQAAS